MDTIQNLIKDLRLKGILLNAVGGNLEISQVDDLDIEASDINLIRENKQDIIEYFQTFLSQKQNDEIPKAPELENYPVSSSQERLWILSQFPETSVAYNMPFQTELEGDYDVESFEKAIIAVIERHEILRTVFIPSNSGEVRQQVLSSNEVDFKMQFVDCSSENVVSEFIETYTKNDAYTPFDLENGPLLRVSLLKVDHKKHVLCVNMHHIISDGWSLKVLAKDILTYYESFKQNKGVNIRPLRIQYKDYAYWQNEQSNTESLTSDEEFWLNKFAEEPSVLDLPTAYVRPNIMTHNGHTLKVELPTKLIRDLKSQCTGQGASIFMGILASWNILFHKYTSHKDIVIGSPVTGRSHASLEDQIGFYVNTILFRNQIDTNQNFTDFLNQIKETTLEAYAHQNYPFDKLIKNLELENDASRNKLFDVLLNYQETGVELSKLSQGEREEVSIIDSGICKSKLDLEISYQNSDDDLSFSIIYNTDLYERNSIERIIQHYVQLLENLLKRPNDIIDVISMISEEEKNQMLFDFNTADKTYSHDKTVVDLFEEQVEVAPESIALVAGKKTYTYKELNEISNQLALYLDSEYSISQGDKIAMMLDRDEWSIISILAIIKLGAIYIPIAKSFPEERKQYIKDDSQYKICIDSLVISQFQSNTPIYGQEKLSRFITPQDLLYIIYTSGTTGKPKGVMLTHSNLVSFIPNLDSKFGCEKYQRIAATTNFTFDISILEVLGGLCRGKEVHLFSDDDVKDPFMIMEKIAQHEIEILQVTPSRLNQLYDTQLAFPNSIKVMLVGGEAMSDNLYNKLKKESFTSINVYGPTETTIWSSSNQLQGSETLSIGSPLENENIYILNSTNTLQPIGVIGEICIGGKGVAAGYLNREELTKEKFIENPFEEGKIYKTGDIGKWLPNGNIAFLGRKDDQVKILGHRIELGEIENNILQSGLVQQSIVLVHQSNIGNKQLIAYVLPNQEYNKETLQAYLKNNLPIYMIPTLIIELSEVTLTTSGKLDRKALPKPNLDTVSSIEYVAPRDKNEELLVELWMEVLKYEKIGVLDNYFKLGGDSMIAVRLISKINKTFDIRLGVDVLYKYQTIAELSSQILQEKNTTNDEELYNEIKTDIKLLKDEVFGVIENTDLIEDVYPMSDIQRGMVFSSIINPKNAVYHDQFVYEIPKLDITSFQNALQLMVKKHSILRTAFDIDSYDNELQIVYKEIPVEIEYQDISLKNQSEKELYISDFVRDERKNPFNLTKAPLWRAAIIDVEPSKSVFVFQFHHAILDGWSIASFNVELFDIYNQLIKGENCTIHNLECDYKEAVVQEVFEKKKVSNTQFWKEELSEYKRLDIFSNITTSDHFLKRYDATFLNSIKERATQDEISLKSILFGAYLYALKMLTYEQDIVVGQVSNNRPIVEDGDKILGCFLNTIPTRVNFENYKGITWGEYFNRIEKQLVNLKGRDRMPLFEISKILNERTEEKNPFFDTIFNFIDFHIYNDFGTDTIQEEEEFKFLKNQSYESTNTMLDLTLSTTGGALNFDYKLSRKLTSDISLEQLHGYLERTLNSYLNTPQQIMSTQDILSLEETQELLEVNSEPKTGNSEITIVDLFSNQVKKVPEALAIVTEKNTYTYEELDVISDQFALFMQDTYDVSNGDLIGMMLARDEWSIITILAIIKLGAVYVPIDKNFPEERKQYVKEDSQYKICINERIIQKFINEKSAYSQELTKQHIEADDLLYVIYTSGSTGKPKGVMVTHENLVSFIPNLNLKLNLDSYNKIAATTSFTFDISILEILGGICTGKEVHLFSDNDVNDPFRIMEKLEKEQIEILQVTPSRLIQLYDTNMSFSDSLEVLLIGGEAMDNNTYMKLKEEPFQVINVYGPTETTIWSSRHILDENENLDIGIPLDQEQIYILNKELALQPKGVLGEICIGGVGVTKGYLNKDTLTTEKFVNNPFVNGQKLYKTGDLGKWLPNGNVSFLGRKDDQVKILGYRIELGEIENALLRHPDISIAVVLAKEVNTAEKLLVAYIRTNKDIDSSDLRKFLKGILPGYMIPSYFVALEEFPLTTSGKVDRKALDKLDEITLSTSVEYVAPTTELQKQLVAIWEKVLQRDKIGIYDNFFDMGGHSLLAVKIASEIQRQLGINVELTKLFLEPNIAELAVEIENQSWQNTSVTEEDVTDRILI